MTPDDDVTAALAYARLVALGWPKADKEWPNSLPAAERMLAALKAEGWSVVQTDATEATR